LLSETNRVFPRAALTRDDIHFAYAGVRPLPFKEAGPESAITRRHIIKANKDIARGLISIIGGKLTTYRSLAEQTVDKLAKLQQLKLPACRTHETDLPGAWGLDRAREVINALGAVSEEGVDRLLSIYGGRAAALADLCSQSPELSRALDGEGRVLAAEVILALRDEFAGTLEDIVFRRMMIGLDADQGRPLYDEIAALAAAEADWSPEQTTQQLNDLNEYARSLRVG
jgi:glycerol-3-phosphate dehydrogenase